MESFSNQLDKNRDEFQKNGFTILRGVFSEDWICKISTAIEKVKADPSKFCFEIQENGDEDGVYFMDYCNWARIPELKELVFSSPAASLVKSIIGSEKVVFYHEHILTKEGGTSKETPWHQDQPYFPVDGNLNCNMWIPIDFVPKESSIRFVKGSHIWGRWFYPRNFKTFDDYDVNYEDNNGRVYESVPKDIDSNCDYDVVTDSYQPGDCVIFHLKTLHAAAPNLKADSRRVVSLRWLAEDAVYVKRPWDESPPLEAHPGLEFGKQLVGEHFPEIPIGRC